MAGLLEGYTGEDTVKDEFGQTQADRREPIWSGLIRAGLLAVAGGGKLMPEQRAQYIAQAGGALADIPGQMVANRSAAAQQVLKSQQLDEGKRKVADRDRIRAMAQSPEFQEAIKAASPAEKLTIQAAVDSGDVGALNTAVGNIGKHDMRAAGLDLKERELALKQKKAEDALNAQGGWGNSFEGRARTILARGKSDPEFAKSTEYAQAHDYLSSDRPVTIGGSTMVLPKLRDIDDYPKPGAAPAPTSPSATNPQTPQPVPAAGEVRKNADGSVTWVEGDDVLTEHPGGKTEVRDKDGKLRRIEQPRPPDQVAQRKLTDETVAADWIKRSGTDFLREWKKATPGDRVKSILGANTPLNAAWTDLALRLKGEAQYNLGVITGPDLGLLQRAISDPATFLSVLTNQEELEKVVNKLITGSEAAITKRQEMMKHQSRAPQAPAAGGSAVPVQGSDGVWRMP